MYYFRIKACILLHLYVNCNYSAHPYGEYCDFMFFKYSNDASHDFFGRYEEENSLSYFKVLINGKLT